MGEDCGAGDVGVRWPFRPEGTEDFRGRESKVNGSGEELAAMSLLSARVARIQTKKRQISDGSHRDINYNNIHKD